MQWVFYKSALERRFLRLLWSHSHFPSSLILNYLFPWFYAFIRTLPSYRRVLIWAAFCPGAAHETCFHQRRKNTQNHSLYKIKFLCLSEAVSPYVRSDHQDQALCGHDVVSWQKQAGAGAKRRRVLVWSQLSNQFLDSSNQFAQFNCGAYNSAQSTTSLLTAMRILTAGVGFHLDTIQLILLLVLWFTQMVLGYIPTPLASAPSTELSYRRCVASNISQSPVFKYRQLLPSRPRCRCTNMNDPPFPLRLWLILLFLPLASFRLPWNSTLPTLKHENSLDLQLQVSFWSWLIYPVHLIMVGFFFGCVLQIDTVLNREAQRSDCFMDIWANSKENYSVQIVFWIGLISSP
jgi:hypothetical protein